MPKRRRDEEEFDLEAESSIELEERNSVEEFQESVAPPKPVRRFPKCYIASAIIAVILLVIFAIVVIVHISNAPPKAKVVVLVSVDGFSWDYLARPEYPTPTLDTFSANGIVSKFHPQFPSKTFPNHYSIITGLYPESHGIVGNSFWDPELEAQFSHTDPSVMLNSSWWLGEPLWNLANRSGLISASYFWPGSEVYINGSRPNYVKPYNASVPSVRRVEQVLNWLDLPSSKRPSFITMYFSNVDTAGHRYGPQSSAIASAVTDLDNSLSVLFFGITARQAALDIHTIIVSDHGMASILGGVFLDQIIPPELLSLCYIPDINTPATNIWAPQENLTQIMSYLQGVTHAKAYYKKDIPAPLNFRNSNRIAPIVVIAELGYLITTFEAWTRYPALLTGGSHGWDPAYSNMTGIFVAQGSRFETKNHYTIPAMKSVDLYNIIADILDITPGPNNGSFVPGILKPKSTRKN